MNMIIAWPVDNAVFRFRSDQIAWKHIAIIWASSQQTGLLGFMSNKGADQPAHTHCLIIDY